MKTASIRNPWCVAALVGWTTLSGLHAAPAAAAPVNLSGWTAMSYPAVSGFGAGVWTVSGGGSVVDQSVNGQPTLYVSDFNAWGTRVRGVIRSGAGDDDFIGFALGIGAGDVGNAAANYLLIDWKAGTQFFDFGAPSASGGGTAQAGLAVSRVRGIPDADEFWQHANLAGTAAGSGLTELARAATLGNTGWVAGVDYEFEFDFGPENLVVKVNNVEQFNLQGNFANGRLAFYNFSQAGVRYSAFEVEDGTFQPPDGRVPAPSTAVLLLAAAVGLGLRGRRRPAQRPLG